MYGGGYIFPPSRAVADDGDVALVDPLTQPLRPEKPGTWKERQDRARWVLHNLSDGELAEVYKQAHDDRRLKLRYDDCDRIRKAEHDQLHPPPKPARRWTP